MKSAMRGFLVAVLLCAANAQAQGRVAYVVIEPRVLSAELADFFTTQLRFAPVPVHVLGRQVEEDAITLTVPPEDADRAAALLTEGQAGENTLVFAALPNAVEIRPNPSSAQQVRIGERLEGAARTVLPSAMITGLTNNRVLIQSAEVLPADLRARIAQSSTVSIHMVVEHLPVDDPLPSDAMLAHPFPDFGRDEEVVRAEPVLRGERFVMFAVRRSEITGLPVIAFQLDAQGARQLCELTRSHVGERFAILINGHVVTAPNMREPICGGTGQIEGDFDLQSATALVDAVNAGLILSHARIVGEGFGDPRM